MAKKNVIRTSRQVAKLASEKLKTGSSVVRKIAGEALENRKYSTKKRG